MENKDESLQSLLPAKLKQRERRKVLAKNSQEIIKINTFDVAVLRLAATLCGVPCRSLPKQGARTIKRLPLKGGRAERRARLLSLPGGVAHQRGGGSVLEGSSGCADLVEQSQRANCLSRPAWILLLRGNLDHMEASGNRGLGKEGGRGRQRKLNGIGLGKHVDIGLRDGVWAVGESAVSSPQRFWLSYYAMQADFGGGH